ncbi:F0F1 ATP synthase subunit A, partial [Candidatus Peregrinibacteria bacterium]|nr:F0F1 ATP synthase subunit A [Candidatus Peregrinibacteria bacterium]
MANIPEIKVPTDALWQVGPVSISNAMFTTWIVMLILLTFAFFVRRKAGVKPSRLQVLFEIILEYMLDKATQAFGTEKRAKKYFPLLFTI